MNLPTFDKALVILAVIVAIIVTDGFARAEPPPPTECDAYCRERRFFKMRDAAGKMSCSMFKYRDCGVCNSTKGNCKRNPDGDMLTNGVCKEHKAAKQKINGTEIKACVEMCPFPVEMNLAFREAAEQPTTYSDVTEWIESPDGVTKCYLEGQPYRNWADENVDWNKKID